MFREQKLSFSDAGRDWPNHDASRFVTAAGIRWHVQVSGRGPVLLLLHGTGAATHSWRHLGPILEEHFTVVAPDLPGHGFTQSPPQALLSLQGMAGGVAGLLRDLDLDPVLVAGHSAGAAVAIRMALDGAIVPRGIVSLNGALLPFGGIATHIFSPLAKLLFLNPFMPRLFAWKAGDAGSVESLIRNTGSTIDPEGVEFYRRLVSSPDHVAAALGMMANWHLDTLYRDLPKLAVPLLLVAGQNDRTIRSEDAFKVQEILPAAKVEIMKGLGHLAHEERADDVAALMLDFARGLGLLTEAVA